MAGSAATGCHADRGGLPAVAGIGAKPAHYPDLLGDADGPGFIEVHAENFMGEGGPPHAWLGRLRERYPLSIHGVGLSIGGEDPLDERHLDRLARLLERYQPESFSEHLAWSSHGGTWFNDLLPVRYDQDSLARVHRHVDQVQSRLRRRLLIENPATYLQFEGEQLSEAQFLSELIARSGCGLLLDVNNAFVGCRNQGRDVHDYLRALPLAQVGQFHLAGHARDRDASGAELLIDDHGSDVPEPVWELFEALVEELGPRPTLVEWDTDVPAYSRLMAQAARAARTLDDARVPAA